MVEQPEVSKKAGDKLGVGAQEENASASSASPSSGERFKLPPLALASGDVFREFWPRVARELNHLLQDVPPVQSASTVQAEEGVQRQLTGTTGGSLALIQTPLAEEALLRRPEDPQFKLPSDVTHSRLLEAILGSRTSSSHTGISTNEPKSNDQDNTTQNSSQRLMAKFVSDITVNDGQMFPPGAEFVKAWSMVNNGTVDWPKSTRLVFVAGDQLTRDLTSPDPVEVGAVAAGKEVEICTGELKAPEITGKYVCYWRLEDGEGNLFGDSIWTEVNVAELSDHTNGSGEGSLAASSIIMPHSAPSSESAKRSTQNDSPTSVSPVTAPSRPASEAVRSQSGSSVSLISFVSSADDDTAMWEDSRSHVHTAESDPAATTEYVVLYDEVSSGDEW